MKISDRPPAEALLAFETALREDLAGQKDSPLTRWLFTDRQLSRGKLADMHFYDFLGREHLQKFFSYIKNFKYPDFFDDAIIGPLARCAATADERVFSRLGLKPDQRAIDNIARYNAQDYFFQRAYQVPERQRVQRLLDFGAGHGRMSNLAFGAPGATVKKYFAVDAIPGSYLTQNMYYTALGHRIYDYLDHRDKIFSLEKDEQEYDVFHFPTWQMKQLPSSYFDMICCVQVLREISSDVLLSVLESFARVLRPGGALYIRDHVLFHNSNGLPQEELLLAHGFHLEYFPRIRDGVEVHGIPRIWRKFDRAFYG